MNLYDCKILLIDDNKELTSMICGILKKNGFDTVYTAGDCSSGMEVFLREQPQLVILDIMLPDGDGFTLFRRLREQSQAPILFLSAKDEDNDRLFGLGLGADDYITKPFLPQELILRIQAILKRVYFSYFQPPSEEGTLILGNRRVLFENAQVISSGGTISLTAKELLLLKKLNRDRGKIVTFDAICQAVWEDSYYGYENTLMVHIRHLREKIEEDPSHPVWIQTVRGLGYRSDWIAGVSHDIRTPLALIVGYADELEKDGELSETHREKAAVIQKQSLMIKQLISDLNLTSKLEYQAQPLSTAEYSPAELLRECAADYYNQGLDDRYEIDLQIGQEEESIRLIGDKGLMLRAFCNLMGNSIRHNPEGCTVFVKMAGEGNRADILFSDSGPGIPAAVIGVLEHPDLYKNAAVHVMGLRIVRQIVEAHKGSVEFVKKEWEDGYAAEIHM